MELPTKEEIATFINEFATPNQIYIKHQDKFWILKYGSSEDDQKRNYLGYELGKNFANVAEIKLINDEELKAIKKLTGLSDTNTTKNTYLVRLANTYTTDELVAKTVEKAVATELVYSAWIRRRDPHCDNRDYVDGISVFFDHHIAFLGERNLANINTFFGQTEDHGRAGNWRVKRLSDCMTFLTRGTHKHYIGAFHYVNDLILFENELEKAGKELSQKIPSNWQEIVKKAGYREDQVEQIIQFLSNNLLTLESDLIIMKNIISQ